MPRISIKFLRKASLSSLVKTAEAGSDEIQTEKKRKHTISDDDTNFKKAQKPTVKVDSGNKLQQSNKYPEMVPGGTEKESLKAELRLSDVVDYNNDRTIYIEGLPFTSNEDEVRQLFSSCGKIVQVRLPKWHDSATR